MTCYFHRRLQIHRTKLENADALYNRHKTLKPEVEELKDIQSFKTYQFRLPENKVDVVISGLGFVTIHCPNALISESSRTSWSLYKRSVNLKEDILC